MSFCFERTAHDSLTVVPIFKIFLFYLRWIRKISKGDFEKLLTLAGVIRNKNKLEPDKTQILRTKRSQPVIITPEDIDYHHGMKTCLTPRNIKKISKLDSKIWMKEDLKEVCPILLQSVVSKSCGTFTNYQTDLFLNSNDILENSVTNISESVTGKTYGLATVSVCIVSTLALLGLIFYQSTETLVFQYASEILLGLGVSSLTTDAVIHKLPSVLGIEKDGNVTVLLVVKLSMVNFAFLVFYLIEAFVAYKEFQEKLTSLNMDDRINTRDYIKILKIFLVDLTFI